MICTQFGQDKEFKTQKLQKKEKTMETLKVKKDYLEEVEETVLAIAEKTDDKEVVDDADLMKKWGLPKAFSANLNSSKYYCEIW